MEIKNPENKNIKTVTEIRDDTGKTIITITGGIYSEGRISDIILWDTENAYMYTAITSLYVENEQVDEVVTEIGFRKIEFTADRGFFLNDRNVKLKGVCCHQSHGGIGVAITEEVYRYRLGKLKAMGVNAYRCSHYPPAPELLKICDELGIMVMDEVRLFSSNSEELSNLRYMVKSARNHPSVILYSIGNEELHSQATMQAGRIAETMVKEINLYDKSRPVTMALLMWNLDDRSQYYSAEELSSITDFLDVAGFNYLEHKWDDFHNAMPQKPMVSTEQSTTKCTRGCYDTDNEKCHLSVLDKTADSYMAAAKKWTICDNTEYMSGQFIWTGFDYYGEPTPYNWPAISSQFGLMDLCGYPKDFYYYYKSWWTNEDVIHIATHWNFSEGDKRDVLIFSNAHEVELFVNNNSIGKKTMDKNGYLLWENVEYKKGEISAVGNKNGSIFFGHS